MPVNIRLTTAATIWTMAVVGLAVGVGYFIAAGAVYVDAVHIPFPAGLNTVFQTDADGAGNRVAGRASARPGQLRHQFNPKEFALHSFSYEMISAWGNGG